MNHLRINMAFNLILTFISSLCIWVSIVHAQTPEVKLLIDASGSMQMQLDSNRYPEGCEVSQRFPDANININGKEHRMNKISKVILVDQDAIGSTPGSTPATYTGVFDPIRQLFSKLPESRTCLLYTSPSPRDS